jgi:hypothetical protein
MNMTNVLVTFFSLLVIGSVLGAIALMIIY